MVIASPFFTIAIGPPANASGVMCPTTNPWVPPLKRPSVISATSLPSPRPMMALVGDNISRMPGPAARTLVADHDHVALLDSAAKNRLERRFLAIEHHRLAGEPLPFLAADLRDRPVGREIAVQHDEMAVALDRVRRTRE